jgi:hypothetical protein
VSLLSKQQWPELRAHASLIVAAVNAAIAGSYVEVNIRNLYASFANGLQV